MSIRAIAFLVTTLIGSCLALAETAVPPPPPAPFGLTWGMATSTAEELGIELAVTSDRSIGVTATARNLPKALRDTEAVTLFFGFDNRLWRVYARSFPFPDDRYGTVAIARFNELAAVLDERYGKGQRIITGATGLYDEPDEFPMSLAKNERIHAGTWDTGDLSIQLQLEGTYSDTFYSIGYDYKPLAEPARQAIKDREKGAL